MPFAISRSIDKETFISICNEGIELSKVALAPFGFPNDLGLVYNSNEEADIEDFKNSFQQWEEVFSRHIFTSLGISDDQVAASFHKYVEVERDTKIIASMQSAASWCSVAINPVPVVDMSVTIKTTTHTSSDSQATKPALKIDDVVHADDIHSFNMCQPEVAALLLHRVLQALITLSNGIEYINNSSSSDNKHTSTASGMDENLQKQLNITIPIRVFPIQETFRYLDNSATTATAISSHKVDVNSSALSNSASSSITQAVTRTSFLKSSLDLLRKAFTIRLQRIASADASSNNSRSNNNSSTSGKHAHHHLSPHLDHKYVLLDNSLNSGSIGESSNDNNNNISASQQHQYEVKVSVDQYHALLQLFSTSSQLRHVLHSFGLIDQLSCTINNADNDNENDNETTVNDINSTIVDPISLLQLGIVPSSRFSTDTETHTLLKRLIISLCSDPTARYILQLQHKLQVLSSVQSASANSQSDKDCEKTKDSSNSNDDSGNNIAIDQEINQLAIQVTKKSLRAATRGIELHRQAKETVTQTGDVEEAINILTHALTLPHKPYEEEEDEEEIDDEEDEEDGISKLLDVHLKCQLLMDRATFSYASLEEIESVWITTAQQQGISVTDLPALEYDQQEQIFTILSLILSDCCKVIDTLDNHCAKAYALLAKQEMFLAKYITVLRLDDDQSNEYRFWDKESHQHQPLIKVGSADIDIEAIKAMINDNNSSGNSSSSGIVKAESQIGDMKTYLLQQAVRHSLSAFLLSGCVDAEHAAVSEEAARECCRVSAKQTYHQRTMISSTDGAKITAVSSSNGSNNSSNSVNLQSQEKIQQKQEQLQYKQFIPKEWLVKAFFIGHDLLSTAYSIDIFHCLVADLENNHGNSNNSDSGSGEDDIHSDTVFVDPVAATSASTGGNNIFPLIQPSLFLLDTITISNSGINDDESVDGDAEVKSSVSNDGGGDHKTINKRKYLRKGDKEAYALLKQLIAIFDSMRLNNNTNNANETKNNSCMDSSSMELNEINAGLENITISDDTDGIDGDNESELQTNINGVNVLFPTQFNLVTDRDSMLDFCNSDVIYSSSTANQTNTSSRPSDDDNNTSEKKEFGYLVDYGEVIDSAIITAQMENGSKVTDIDSSDNPTGTTTRAARARQFENDQEADLLMKITDGWIVVNSKRNNDKNKNESNLHQQQQTEAPNSQAYITALALLSTPLAQQLTGVTITSIGKIVSIESISSLQKPKTDKKTATDKEDDKEDEWDDVEDEEDDDDEEDEGEDKTSTDGDDKANNDDDSNSSSKLLVSVESIAIRNVSYALQARLLNILSSVCYLAGDAIHAIECLRASRIASSNAIALEEDIVLPASVAVVDALNKGDHDHAAESDVEALFKSSDNSGGGQFISIPSSSIAQHEQQQNKEEDILQMDTTVKLASLLTDMDETDEAELLLYSIKSKDANNKNNVYALIHLAELEMQKNQFESAVEHLSDAKFIARQQFVAVMEIRKLQAQQVEVEQQSTKSVLHQSLTTAAAVNGTNEETSQSTTQIVKQYLNTIIKQKSIIPSDFHQYQKTIKNQLLIHLSESITSSIYSLLSATLFRLSPTQPEIPLLQIKEGLEHHPSAPYMLLCLGEIHSQTGDAVAALAAFKKAHEIDCYNPLPYLNAARVYQQIKQTKIAFHYTQFAIQIDPDLAMTKVDLAQQYLHSGRTEEALKTLDSALILARHVSEIRDVLTARTVALMQVQLQKEGFWNANVVNSE